MNKRPYYFGFIIISIALGSVALMSRVYNSTQNKAQTTEQQVVISAQDEMEAKLALVEDHHNGVYYFPFNKFSKFEDVLSAFISKHKYDLVLPPSIAGVTVPDS